MDEKRQIVLVLLALGVVGGWFVIGVIPRHREIMRLRADITRSQHLWQEDAKLSGEVTTLKQALARAKNVLDLAESAARDKDQAHDLLGALVEAAQSTGIQLTKFSPNNLSAQASQGATRGSFHLAWKGSFTQCAQFLGTIESRWTCLRIKELVLRSKDQNRENLEVDAVCEELPNKNASGKFSQVSPQIPRSPADRL